MSMRIKSELSGMCSPKQRAKYEVPWNPLQHRRPSPVLRRTHPALGTIYESVLSVPARLADDGPVSCWEQGVEVVEDDPVHVGESLWLVVSIVEAQAVPLGHCGVSETAGDRLRGADRLPEPPTTLTVKPSPRLARARNRFIRCPVPGNQAACWSLFSLVCLSRVQS